MNYIDNIKTKYPELQIKLKSESLYMKIISYILFFNKSFTTGYITTIGSTIYLPEDEKTKKDVADQNLAFSPIIFHELMHAMDHKKYGLLFNLGYLSPQILALLALPLFFFHWYLGLACLLFLLPIPSYFRKEIEHRGYAVQLYCYHKLENHKYTYDYSKKLDMMASQFSGPYYYYMWTLSDMRKVFESDLEKIKSGNRPFEHEIFDLIDQII